MKESFQHCTNRSSINQRQHHTGTLPLKNTHIITRNGQKFGGSTIKNTIYKDKSMYILYDTHFLLINIILMR